MSSRVLCMYICMCVYAKSLQPCATLCNPMDSSLPPVGFSKQEYWSGLSCPSPGDLPDPGVKPASLMYSALAGRFFTSSVAWETHMCC